MTFAKNRRKLRLVTPTFIGLEVQERSRRLKYLILLDL